MRQKLQNVIFPIDEKLQPHWRLFYTGPRCVQDAAGRVLLLAGHVIGFATCLNGFSLEKWGRYTPLEAVELRLTVQGNFRLELVGYSLNPTQPERHLLYEQECSCDQPREIRAAYPADARDQMLAFEIHPYTGCVLHAAAYFGSFPNGCGQEVVLSLATTTCRKEALITRNVDLIRRELLGAGSDLRQNLYVHVVDNGGTLDPAAVNGWHIALHPNKNAGGSGGYARGMIESLRQTPRATHVLLMDDDVLVLPESIRRTYVLLTLLRPEYRDSFVSGAMLDYDAMDLQHEDVGTVADNGDWRPARPGMDQTDLANVLRTNRELLPLKRPYAGWWYCCIPAAAIEKNGLPLPLFLRGDDIEYSLRCRPRHFLTMTGICVWHMGFGAKYNAAMDIYQRIRNMLAARAVTGVLADVDIEGYARRIFRNQLREFAYNGAELVLRAVEDYLEGPEQLVRAACGERLRENTRLNETLQPLETFNVEVRLEEVYSDPPRRFLDKVIGALTCNGHRLWPRRLLRGMGVIGYDDSYQPQAQALREKLLAVNVRDRTAALRVQDRARFHSLTARWRRACRRLEREGPEVARRYAAARARLTSEAFWREYLEL